MRKFILDMFAVFFIFIAILFTLASIKAGFREYKFLGVVIIVVLSVIGAVIAIGFSGMKRD